MLNATLTVRARQAGSHQKKGWEEFTDAIIRILSEKKENLIFLLWGRFAQNKAQLIDSEKHHILTAAHPSPFSAHSGFFGCNHFSKTNEILNRLGKNQIKWDK
jgi:uracil-DNA glycosylase